MEENRIGGRVVGMGKVFLSLSIVLCGGWSFANGQTPDFMSMSQTTAKPDLDPTQTVGYQTCLKCHTAEVAVWSSTWHQTSIDSMHRSPEAKQTASRLGLKSIKQSERCVKCHYTPTQSGDSVTVSAAVSCECCHGAGKDWVQTHYPPKERIGSETPDEKAKRVSQNLQNGMRNRHNTFTMARICMRCHNVADEELVNVGGHSVGGATFEMVSWSQGLMRHRFVSGKGQNNAPNSPERLRLIFVSGMIADLEFSLRATANATSAESFGKQVARRASTAAKRLASVYKKTKTPILKQILDVYSSVQLKVNNRDQLTDAAEQIRKLGVKFGAETSGANLKSVGPFVPKPASWIFE